MFTCSPHAHKCTFLILHISIYTPKRNCPQSDYVFYTPINSVYSFYSRHVISLVVFIKNKLKDNWWPSYFNFSSEQQWWTHYSFMFLRVYIFCCCLSVFPTLPSLSRPHPHFLQHSEIFLPLSYHICSTILTKAPPTPLLANFMSTFFYLNSCVHSNQLFGYM